MKAAPAHWVWESYADEEGAAFAEQLEGLTPEQANAIACGRPLDPIPTITVTHHVPGEFHDQLGSAWGGIFVSPRLREVLEQHSGARLQFVPVKIKGRSKLRYDAVNVLETVPAMDLDRSKFDHYPGPERLIAEIKRFVPRPIPPAAPAVFHVAEVPTMLLVRDELRRRMLEATEHAGRFTPAEKFRSFSF